MLKLIQIRTLIMFKMSILSDKKRFNKNKDNKMILYDNVKLIRFVNE